MLIHWPLFQFNDFTEWMFVNVHISSVSNWKKGIKMHILRNVCGKKKQASWTLNYSERTKTVNISYLFIQLARQ